MSARLLKKALKEQGQRTQQFIAEEEDDDEQQLNGDESESPDSGTRSLKNPFDLLNEDDEEDNPDQVEEPEVADETSGGKQRVPVMKNTISQASDNKSKKKKKKKEKKSKGGNSDKSEKSLDAALETLSLDVSSSEPQSDPVKTKSENAKVCDNLVKRTGCSILQVDPKHLNAENELKRNFGSKVV
ncbi:hypothetical protein SLE2022_182520 [Rubroshorea leprosula]